MRLSLTSLPLLLLAAPLAAQAPTQQSSDPRVARADSLFIARDYKAAVTVYSGVAASAPLDNRSRYRYALSLALSGNPEKAAPLLDQLAPNGNPLVIFNAGSVHASLGHADTAFAYLNMAVAGGFANLQAFTTDTAGFGKLRADPRYAAAEKRFRDALTPCVNSPDAHKFDFWVGEWNVVNVAGQPAGTSSVQKILSDCVVFENWTAAGGNQGKSLNGFNRALGKWQQFWMDQFGNVTEYRDSEWVGESLRFIAIPFTRQGQTVHTRMTFTPIDQNTVRQHGETSTDGGKTWTTGYDLTYRRKVAR